MPNKFTKWIKYTELNLLEKYNWEYPGIYVIAKSATDISGTPFDYIKNIVYIGMTNTYGGLKGRITQFDYSIRTRCSQHSGANRFLAEYGKKDIAQWIKKLYISIMPFPVEETDIDLELKSPEDLLVAGEILRQEYVCYSEYKSRFKRLPIFNDRKAPPSAIPASKFTYRTVDLPAYITKKKAPGKPGRPAKKIADAPAAEVAKKRGRPPVPTAKKTAPAVPVAPATKAAKKRGRPPVSTAKKTAPAAPVVPAASVAKKRGRPPATIAKKTAPAAPVAPATPVVPVAPAAPAKTTPKYRRLIGAATYYSGQD